MGVCINIILPCTCACVYHILILYCTCVCCYNLFLYVCLCMCASHTNLVHYVLTLRFSLGFRMSSSWTFHFLIVWMVTIIPTTSILSVLNNHKYFPANEINNPSHCHPLHWEPRPLSLTYQICYFSQINHYIDVTPTFNNGKSALFTCKFKNETLLFKNTWKCPIH